MLNYISTKELYGRLREVSEQVMGGEMYIVLKYSKPAFKIIPFDQEELPSDGRKYSLKDLPRFLTKETGKKKSNLAQHYKKYIYGGMHDYS